MFIIIMTFSIWLFCIVVSDIAVFIMKIYENKNINYKKFEKFFTIFYLIFNYFIFFLDLFLKFLIKFLENEFNSIKKTFIIIKRKILKYIIIGVILVIIGVIIYLILRFRYKINILEIYQNKYEYLISNILNFLGLIDLSSTLAIFIIDLPYHMKGTKKCKCCCYCEISNEELNQYNLKYVYWGIGKTEEHKNKNEKILTEAKNHLKFAYNQYIVKNETNKANIIKNELEKKNINIENIDISNIKDEKYEKYFEKNSKDLEIIIDDELIKLNVQSLKINKLNYYQKKYKNYNNEPNRICCKNNCEAIFYYTFYVSLILVELSNLACLDLNDTKYYLILSEEERLNKTKEELNDEIVVAVMLLLYSSITYLIAIFYGLRHKTKFSSYMFISKHKANIISLIEFLNSFTNMIFPLYYCSTAIFNRKVEEDYNIIFIQIYHWSYTKNGVFSKVFIYCIRYLLLIFFIIISYCCERVEIKKFDFEYAINDNQEFYESEGGKKSENINTGKDIYEKNNLLNINTNYEEKEYETQDVPIN